MYQSKDVFGPGSNIERRFVKTNEELAQMVQSCRTLKHTIVLTSGSWDLLHEGHCRYLEQGKKRGDVHIVGVDSDKKIKTRKGENRPIVAQNERMEMLCHLRHVDLVVLKEDGGEKWQLIKLVRPDVLIATQETYTADELEELKQYCGEVVVLPPQGADSTTARVRLLLIEATGKIRKRVEEVLERVQEVIVFIDSLHAKKKDGGG